MADTKPKKTEPTKKIVDVTSEGDAASGTSRPIIVSNRPIVKDPMMAEVSQLTGGAMDASETSTPTADTTVAAGGAPEIVKQKKVAIKVDTHDEKPQDTPEVAKEVPATAVPPSKKKLVIKPIEPVSEEKPATVSPDEPTIADLVKPEVMSGKSDKSTQDKPEEPSVQEDSEPAASVREEAKPEETPAEEEILTDAEPVQDSEKDDDTAKIDVETETETEQIELDAKGKPNKKVKQTGELTPEQQKAIESGEYFLPITTAETRRLRREIVFATLFVTILIVVWLDIMLDAGLLQIGDLKAVTDFF